MLTRFSRPFLKRGFSCCFASWVALLFLVSSSFVCAQKGKVGEGEPYRVKEVTLGDERVKILIPKEFHDILPIPSRATTHVKRTIESNGLLKLLAYGVVESDLAIVLKDGTPELNQYLVIQTLTQNMAGKMPRKEFTEFKALLVSQQEALMKAAPKLMEEFTSGDEVLRKMELKVLNLIPLGVYDETKRSVCLAALGKMQGRHNGKPKTKVMVNAYAFALVQGKIIQCTVLKQFEKKGDIEDARQVAKRWASAQVAKE